MSSYGQGSLAFSPRSIPGASPVPPFPINSADNGLSVDAITGRIVLGNDVGGGLADFLSSREIEMAGFLLQLLSAGTRQLYIDPTTGEYFIGDIDGAGNGATWIVNDANNTIAGFNTAGNALILNMQGRVYDMGDIDAVGNNTFMQIDDFNRLFRLNDGADPYLLIDNANDVWAIGDYNNFVKPVIDAAFNPGGNMYINQYVQDQTANAYVNFDIAVNDTTLAPRMRSDMDNGTDRTIFEQQQDKLFFRYNNFDQFSIDLSTNIYGIGDLGIANNGTRFRLLDTAFEGVVIDSNTGIILTGRNDSQQYGFGYLGGTSYGILIDGVNGRTDINAAGDEWVLIDTAANTMSLGRNDGLGVNGFILFDVDNNLIDIQGNTFVGGRFDFVNNVHQIGGNGPTNAANGVGVDAGNSFAYLRQTGAAAQEFYMDGVLDKFVFNSNSLTSIININGNDGFTGTVTPVNSITVVGGIVTNVT